MKSKTFQMTLEAGLYAKWAKILVEKAMEYQSDMTLEAFHKCIDLKSIMGVLSLGICKDAEIIITASGQDEAEALEGIKKQLVDLKFGIEKE